LLIGLIGLAGLLWKGAKVIKGATLKLDGLGSVTRKPYQIKLCIFWQASFAGQAHE
jgi:hypothetical protein